MRGGEEGCNLQTEAEHAVVASKETKKHGTAQIIPSRVVSAGSGESRRGKQHEGQRHGSHTDDEPPTHYQSSDAVAGKIGKSD